MRREFLSISPKVRPAYRPAPHAMSARECLTLALDSPWRWIKAPFAVLVMLALALIGAAVWCVRGEAR